MNEFSNYFLKPKWPVFYEDNHLLVIYKPSGLLIQGDRTDDVSLLDLAKQWIKVRYQKPGKVFLAPVHRLDRPVAGVTVFARTSKAASRLAGQFREGTVEKKYLAVVQGVVPGDRGRLIDCIKRRGPTSVIVDATAEKSRQAVLFYRVIDREKFRSFLEIDLVTGRHHQIRAQLANMGFPVEGDLRYGASRPMAQRQLALFAKELCFYHPTGRHRMRFIPPLPAGWPWPGTGDDPDAPPWNYVDLVDGV